MTTDTDAGRDLTRAEFERACSLLPPDFAWGLPVTPRLVLEVANALAPTPSAQEEAVRVPEGYALVPLKPTAEIVRAGGEARIADFNRNGTTLSVRDANRVAEAMYRAMIAAAPAASAGDQEVDRGR
jgi:hypothetical protein